MTRGPTRTSLHLPLGTRLQNRYSVGKLLWHDPGAITYLGADAGSTGLVLIREFFPEGSRRRGTSVEPASALEAAEFRHALRDFLARSLAAGQSLTLPRVLDTFEENNTAYLVLEHHKNRKDPGRPFEVAPAQRGTLPDDYSQPVASGPATPTRIAGHTGRVTALSFTPDGSLLVSSGADGVVRFWDTGTGTPYCTLPRALPRMPDALPRSISDTLSMADTLRRGVTGPEHDATALAVSGDGNILAAGDEDGIVRLWQTPIVPGSLRSDHAPTRPIRLLRVLKGHLGRITGLAFSRPHTGIPGVLATASSDSTVRVWDTETGTATQILSGHASGVCAVAFPAGEPLLASAGATDIVLWSLHKGTSLATLSTPDHEVTSLSFSPNGRLLASGSFDKTVKLWDVQSCQCLWSLTGHTGAVSSVAFSPDGKQLASGAFDKTVRLWDPWMGELTSVLTGHPERVNAVAYAPHGRSVAAATGTEVWLWNLT